MRYCEISKEMSSLYFGLAVFCLFEASVPEFDTQPLLPKSCGLCTVYTYTEYCVKFRVSSFQLAEYIKPKIQRRHLVADRTIPHLWVTAMRSFIFLENLVIKAENVILHNVHVYVHVGYLLISMYILMYRNVQVNDRFLVHEHGTGTRTRAWHGHGHEHMNSHRHRHGTDMGTDT